MAGIDTELNIIEGGIYGRDVRQAIHDGLEKTYRDASVNPIRSSGHASLDASNYQSYGLYDIDNFPLNQCIAIRNNITESMITHLPIYGYAMNILTYTHVPDSTTGWGAVQLAIVWEKGMFYRYKRQVGGGDTSTVWENWTRLASGDDVDAIKSSNHPQVSPDNYTTVGFRSLDDMPVNSIWAFRSDLTREQFSQLPEYGVTMTVMSYGYRTDVSDGAIQIVLTYSSHVYYRIHDNNGWRPWGEVADWLDVNELREEVDGVKVDLLDVESQLSEIYTISQNLYDYKNDMVGYTCSDSGEINPNTDYRCSQKIYVKPLSTITLSIITTLDLVHGAYKVVIFNSADVAKKTLYFGTSSNETTTYIFESDDIYIRIVSRANCNPYMVNYGTELLDYVPYGYKGIKEDVDIPQIESLASKEYVDNIDTLIEKTMRSIFTVSPNLYNNANDIKNHAINDSSGEIYEFKGYKVSDKIYFNGEKISSSIITKTDILNGAYKICVYRDDDSISRTLFFGTNENNKTTVSSNNEEHYIRIVSRNDANPYMVNYGTELLDYVPYDKKINDDVKVPNTSNNGDYVFSTTPIIGNYEPLNYKGLDGTADSESEFNYNTITASLMYSKYDALMAEYPDYITRKFLGYDQTGILPIYEYDLAPSRPKAINTGEGSYTDNHKPYPKFLITTGMHGFGPSGDPPVMPYALYWFLYDICHNWKDNDLLSYLRWKVRFKIIPISNPWGFNNKTRTNSNGVDINRNFDFNWEQGTYGTVTYGGTAPWSEAETRILRDFILANQDAVAHTDFHSTGRQRQDRLMYFAVNENTKYFYPAYDLITDLSNIWNKRDYPNMEKLDFHGYITIANIGCVYGWVEKNTKIPSCIFEGFLNYENSGITNDMTKDIIGMGYEEIANWILYVLRYRKDELHYIN